MTERAEEDRERERERNDKKDADDTCKVFITNIEGSQPEETVEEELRKLFSKYGHVVSLNAKKNQNATYSFAFVQMEKAEEAGKAIQELDQMEFYGKKMRVRQDRQNEGCFYCKQSGHFARECPNNRQNRPGNYHRESPSRSHSRERRHSPQRHHSRHNHDRNHERYDDRRYRDERDKPDRPQRYNSRYEEHQRRKHYQRRQSSRSLSPSNRHRHSYDRHRRYDSRSSSDSFKMRRGDNRGGRDRQIDERRERPSHRRHHGRRSRSYGSSSSRR